MNTLLHFLLCLPRRSPRNVFLGSPHIPFLSLSEYYDVIRGPLFQPYLGSPNPKSTTGRNHIGLKLRLLVDTNETQQKRKYRNLRAQLNKTNITSLSVSRKCD